MQSNQIKEWIKANKLLSAIIVGVIIVAIILYLGANKQVPEAEEQPEKAAVETAGGEVAEVPTGEVAAPETVPEEVPPAETAEEVPPEEPVGTEETTQGGTT
ncbi:MAG: hypothetical protein AABX74_03520 [Nanoarchaeota archaeon]